jgi:hypothetical protein
MPETDPFDVDDFIAKAKGLELLALSGYCRSQLKWLDAIKFTRGNSLTPIKDKIIYYRDFIREYCFFLQSGIKPGKMSDTDFERTKAITEALVAKGVFEREALGVYSRSGQ